jgi:hypothetical protein
MLAPRLMVLVLAVLACANATAAEVEPIAEGGTLTGRLRLVPARHPNGTKIEAYQIVSRPRAMPKGDDFCDYDKGATTFHLFTMKAALRKQLDPMLGKTVSVKVVSLFCSETAVPQWELLAK